jgi:hypothetical protein
MTISLALLPEAARVEIEQRLRDATAGTRHRSALGSSRAVRTTLRRRARRPR